MKLRMVILQGVFVTQMVVLQAWPSLPSADQMGNAIAMASDYIADGDDIAKVINDAHNLITQDHHLSPTVSKKFARLSLKINKNIKTLVSLTRQIKNPTMSKKMLALDIMKTVEKIGLYSKEIYKLYRV